MEAKAERGGDRSWRLWALVPILLLAVAVGGYVASGSSLAGLIGSNPPQPDEFDVRRVEFKPGEIRVRVTNPQQDDLTIASVTVDDAIVPFSLDGPQTLGRLRSSTIVIPYDWIARRSDLGRSHELHRNRDGRGDRGRGRDAQRHAAAAFSATRSSASSSVSCPLRSGCSGCRRCDGSTSGG